MTNVASTDTFLGSGHTPVIRPLRPFIVVHDNFILPERLLNLSGIDTSGGILHGVKAKPRQMDVYDTSCEGRMCDQSTLLTNNVLRNYCACMQMDKSGKIMIVFTMTVTQPDGNKFEVTFASKWQVVHAEFLAD